MVNLIERAIAARDAADAERAELQLAALDVWRERCDDRAYDWLWDMLSVPDDLSGHDIDITIERMPQTVHDTQVQLSVRDDEGNLFYVTVDVKGEDTIEPIGTVHFYNPGRITAQGQGQWGPTTANKDYVFTDLAGLGRALAKINDAYPALMFHETQNDAGEEPDAPSTDT